MLCMQFRYVKKDFCLQPTILEYNIFFLFVRIVVNNMKCHKMETSFFVLHVEWRVEIQYFSRNLIQQESLLFTVFRKRKEKLEEAYIVYINLLIIS